MKILTKYHGEREYEEKDIILFDKGLPGFENLNKFIMFQAEENEIFNILHSIEDSGIGFIVISPFNVMEDYEVNIPDKCIEELNIKKPEDVLIVNTVTINSNLKNITTNLQAPIIINIQDKKGEQIILDKEEYSIKYPIFREWKYASDFKEEKWIYFNWW